MTLAIGLRGTSPSCRCCGDSHRPRRRPRLGAVNHEAEEQDVLVVLRLSNRLMGTADERRRLEQFGEELETAVVEAGVGEYDGEEIGGGECTLFFAGPDAARIAEVLLPLLQHRDLCRGGKLVRQSGEDGASRKEVRL